jgi:lipoate---protein ligase
VEPPSDPADHAAVDPDDVLDPDLVVEPLELVHTSGEPWSVELATGTAAQLHLDAPDLGRRTVRVQQVRRPAVVLGSTQREDVVDAAALAAHGLQLATRRSGGGAVLLGPAAQVWIDVSLPVGDPLWVDDVGRSSWWLGDVWAATLRESASHLVAPPVVHHGGVDDPELGRLVCFAALGPGEVSVAGRKVVGISQRRTRDGARFQCVVHLRFEPTALLQVLRLGEHRRSVEHALTRRAAGWQVPAGASRRDVPGWSVVEEFLAQLP